METFNDPQCGHCLPTTLYSLEKLIEWKLFLLSVVGKKANTALYSLEKLIEWKQGNILFYFIPPNIYPLLAREIN